MYRNFVSDYKITEVVLQQSCLKRRLESHAFVMSKQVNQENFPQSLEQNLCPVASVGSNPNEDHVHTEQWPEILGVKNVMLKQGDLETPRIF